MGLLDFLIGARRTEPVEEPKLNQPTTQVKTIEVGTPGTEIYSGEINEEYLSELRGQSWQEKIDKMWRSDGNVKMTVSALVMPLKSSNWYFVQKEDSPEAELQKKLLEKALFEDMEKSFTMFLNEALTMVRCGYSLFDITHQVKEDSELGVYNTLKSLSFRSQKTIENWYVDRSGKLTSVRQVVFGDEGGAFNLDAQFLLHFAPEQEGDNYEGVSTLRSMYGCWLRKDRFLKLLAVGMEKYSIPTPVLKVPAGKENSPEFKAAEKALKCYTSGQANYLILPSGWELEFNNITFDAQKLREAINAENQEMVNSILASFLLLGQNGAGSLALSSSLSDFFKQTVTYLADHITEVLEKRILKPLIKMNLGDVPLLVELKADGLDEKADATWAQIITNFKNAGLIQSEAQLKKYIADKLKLPFDEELEKENKEQSLEQV